MPAITTLAPFSRTDRAANATADHSWSLPNGVTREVYIECTTGGDVTLHWQGDAAGTNRVYSFVSGDRERLIGACDMVVGDSGSSFVGTIEGRA